MFVDLSDGKCRSCGGQLEITGADDVSLDVECTACGDAYTVEADAFNDGGSPTKAAPCQKRHGAFSV